MPRSQSFRAAAVLALAGGLLGNGTPITSDPEIHVHVVRYGEEDAAQKITYDRAALNAMVTLELESLRGTKQKPAMRLVDILTKDTGIELDQILAVVLMNTGMPPVLRGDDLAHLDTLLLASGEDKGKFGHPWSLAPRDTASWQLLRARVGSRRKHGVYRIDIHLKPVPAP